MKTRFCIALLTLTVQEICGILVNVALGKKTTQLEGEETWPSSNAVDGIKECKIINSTFLTLSGKSDLPWWKLDLVELFQIHQINVFGRDDNQFNQLQGFRLYLSKDENITDSNIVYTNTASDYNNGHIVIEVNLTGLFRFVKLDLSGAYRNSGEKGPIVLCEVEILVKMTNIAVGKPATMSSTFSNMIASKCVDGNADRNPDSCNCCSHSRSEENPWITIDLQEQQNIVQIHVFGRNDVVINNRVVTGLEIYANGTSDLLLGHNTFENSTDVIVTTPQGLHTQYITLKRPSPRPFTEWYLVVCEVEIYTRYCKPGTYGVLCQEQCGHCRQKPCEVDSGYCPNAECLEGWTGLQCKQKDCDLGYFGLNCSSVCSTHCFNNATQCNKTTGKCMQGCETGYMGQNCTTQCMAGQFGRDCNQTCTSNCVNGYDQCSKTTGECQQGCVAGFTGLNCSTPCETGLFGVNCSSYCSIHCYQGREKCNKSSGVCMEGCDSGYMGNNCSEVCLDGHYGRNCNRTCSGHCIGGHAQCNKSTGECVKGCVPGFTGYNCFEECPNGTFGINCVGKCHCINETVCRKTDGNCSYGCAFGWSGSNCSNDLNLIKRIHENVTTNQSSIFAPNNDPNNYNSQKAIDGVQNYAIDSCNCCSVTNGDSPSWWQIDLKQKYLIGGLRIFGRESNNNDQLENAEVYAGNISTLFNPIANMTSVFTVPEMTVTRRHFTKQFESIIAQFFLVELSKTILTLCEFKLYVIECDIGTFGTGCMHHCHCKDKRTCNQVTGRCQTPGCLAGWQGEACENVCDDHKFGEGCNNTCNCINGTLCDHSNGTCFTDQCDPGWLLPTCSKACNPRDFGDGCKNTCHCKDQTSCDHISGFCDKGLCDPGWLLPTCSKACNYRTFGDNCSATCHCFNNTSCIAATGKCDAGECDPGWTTDSCDKTCDHRTFGYNCSSTCNCINNTTCNATTGQCFLGFCESGWQGEKCDHACDHRSFGYNCSSTCNCINNSTCNASTGQCFLWFCESGWQGEKCDHACEHRSFGLNCSSICHCYKNTTCDKTTGECFKKLCDSGWQGTSCFQASPERAKDSTSAAVVGGTVAAVLVILAVVIGLIVLRRMRLTKRNTTKETAFSHLDRALEEKSNVQRRRAHNAHEIKSYEGEQETNMTSTDDGDYYSFNKQVTGIRIHELWDYIHSKIENNCEQLISEFRSLPQGLVHAARAADHITNRGKNRYKEMYAYDHTRVILDDVSTTGGDNTTDYINACYIDGYDKVKKFVASQGPTKNMINDFWRMVWQLKSDKIVMLTNLIEMGTIKCLQYWPKEEEGETECSFGDIVVKLLETKTYLDFNIRLFEVGKNGKAFRRIRQFHFKSWPDKDVPDSTWCLVNFWRAVDTNAASNAGPIVVHCSAGVGRTGTFIGLDNLVNQARQEGCVRPLQVVQTLRSQRVNMVQTKEQYIYLHEAVADAMYIGTHVIWTKQLKNVLEFMVHKDKNEARTRLQIQFELIEMSIENQSSDVSDSPEYSNVETLMSESDEYKPKIKKRGSKFVEQLRAMYIPNYKGKSTFLVSMSPDRDTLEEFWSLIDENNIKTVIMLTEKSSTCYQPSCELGSNSEGGARFSVNKIEEKIRKGYIQRTFTFKESGREEEDSLTTVKQFEYTAWKDGYPAPGDTASFLDMTEAVLKWQPHLSESQPLLVHCGDGFTRSGVACVLLNELQRMKYEGGHVNIVESVKMMKKRQRHLISSYEQYKFCFDLIMDHINRTEVYQNL